VVICWVHRDDQYTFITSTRVQSILHYKDISTVGSADRYVSKIDVNHLGQYTWRQASCLDDLWNKRVYYSSSTMISPFFSFKGGVHNVVNNDSRQQYYLPS